jgi:hypothetical protein
MRSWCKLMMMMVIKDAMFCAPRLVSERSLRGRICAGNVGSRLKLGKELFTEAPVNKNLPLFLCSLIKN